MVLDEVKEIKPDSREIITSDITFKYDYLIVAGWSAAPLLRQRRLGAIRPRPEKPRRRHWNSAGACCWPSRSRRKPVPTQERVQADDIRGGGSRT